MPTDPFVRGLLFGIILGSLGMGVILLIAYEVYCSLRERKERRIAPSLDIRAERVRLLRDECRNPEYPKAEPEDETRPMEILVEEDADG
jgi:hypothetical protein